ncbi:hypothetical protein F4776DRAFT_611496 [Hypoxylon sp. NC0597]|nr:hypothetical protein F4776DRAFT_611496 [Hypoxylon sp. NC0597]
MATHATGFLDIPLELRQDIYKDVLRPYEPWLLGFRGKKYGPWSIRHRMDLGLLGVNRQISAEAYEILIKNQQFVRIITRGVPMCTIFHRERIPVLSLNGRQINQCKVPVMTHCINVPSNTPVETHHLLMLSKDLDTFCRGIAIGEAILEGFGTQSIHVITLHDPFYETSSPGYMNVTRQEHLLKPYQKLLRGFVSFRLTGNIHPILANTVATVVKRPAAADYAYFLRDLLSSINIARAAHAREDNRLATSVLLGVERKIRTFSSRTAWPVIKRTQGDEFTNAICDILLMSSQTLITIATWDIFRLVENKAGRDLIMLMVGRVYRVAETGQRAGVILGAQWQIDNQSRGMLALQLAFVHRVARHDPVAAQRHVEIAAELLPGFVRVEREQAAIDQWRAG